jgi:hypothetical protein
MKDKKYAYSRARICKSPFSKGKTYEEALKMVKEKEKAYNSGKEIGFSYESSLKSMGIIKRSSGKYTLGKKYK